MKIKILALIFLLFCSNTFSQNEWEEIGIILWKNKFFLSINFDPNTSVGGYFGLKILDKFVVGYSYENSINYFDNYNNGNHSIFFKIKLNRSINNYQSPCYSIIN